MKCVLTVAPPASQKSDYRGCRQTWACCSARTADLFIRASCPVASMRFVILTSWIPRLALRWSFKRCVSLARPLFSETVVPRPSEIMLCRAIGNNVANEFLEGSLQGSSRARLEHQFDFYLQLSLFFVCLICDC